MASCKALFSGTQPEGTSHQPEDTSVLHCLRYSMKVSESSNKITRILTPALFLFLKKEVLPLLIYLYA